MEHFPIFMSIRDRPCLVVGGGIVASRKIRRLREAGARVRVIAPELHRSLREAADQDLIQHEPGHFHPHMLDGVVLVIAATDDETVNQAVAAAAKGRGIPVNVADRPELCSFIMPAVVDRSPVLVAIGTAGNAPVLARALRARLEIMLPRGLGAVASLAGQWRERVGDALSDMKQRRRFWERMLDGLWDPHGVAPTEAGFAELLERMAAAPAPEGELVFLHCPSPDPELLTLKALRALQAADVIFHAPALPASILDYARREADLVGRVPRSMDLEHAEDAGLLEEMIDLGRAGARMVCLLDSRPAHDLAAWLQAIKSAGIGARSFPAMAQPETAAGESADQPSWAGSSKAIQ